MMQGTAQLSSTVANMIIYMEDFTKLLEKLAYQSASMH